MKSGGTARTLRRGPSLSRAWYRFDWTSAGDISVVGLPAAKKRLILLDITPTVFPKKIWMVLVTVFGDLWAFLRGVMGKVRVS